MGLRTRLLISLLLLVMSPLLLVLLLTDPLLDGVQGEWQEVRRGELALDAARALDHRPLLEACEAFCDGLRSLEARDWQRLADPTARRNGRRWRRSVEAAQQAAMAAGVELFSAGAKDADPAVFAGSFAENRSALSPVPRWRLADQSRALVAGCRRPCLPPDPTQAALEIACGRRLALDRLAAELGEGSGLEIRAEPRLPGAEPRALGPGLSEIPLDGRGDGTLRLAADLSGVGEGLRSQLHRRLLLTAAVAGALALGLALVLGEWIARPLREMASAVGAVAADPQSAVPMPPAAGEIGKLGRSVERMLEALGRERRDRRRAERTAAWQQVARRLAHEIRNPLTPVRLAVENLQRAAQRGDEALAGCLEDEAGAILEEVGRLERLVREFSEFARLPRPRIEPLRIDDVLQQALAAAGAPGDRVRRTGPVSASVRGDRDLLALAFGNLVRNAFAAMGSTGKLEIRLEEQPNAAGAQELSIVFHDEGPGIPEELNETLFEPYVTGRPGEGTGLGLAIVQQIIAEHGGAVSAHNAARGGAVFRITLPSESAAPISGGQG